MRKVVLALMAALSALLAVPAMAADGTLSAGSPTYKWEGGPANGIGQAALPGTPGAGFATARCTEIYACDNELLELKEQGTLTLDIKAGEGSNDLDVRLYASDADGTAPGFPGPNPVSPPPDPIAEDIREDKDAKLTVRNLKPGFYVAQVAFFNATNGVYAGTATFTPAAPPAAAAPAPPATPAPAAAAPTQTAPTASQNKADEAKRKKALAKCNKKAKKIKNKKKRKAAQKKCAKKHAKKKA